MEDLMRGNERMNPIPVNYGREALVAELLGGNAAFVRLEPGDATRYEFVICLVHLPGYDRTQRQLVVTRLRGPMPYKTMVVEPRPFEIQTAAGELSGGNAWTVEFLTYWFRWLLVQLGRPTP